jgi:hypothetical protein
MAFADSRLGPGTLTFGTGGTQDASTQVSTCTLTPSVDSTDGTPTLATPEPPPLSTTSYTLDFTAINDFTNPGGFQRYCFDHDGEEQDFEWTPNTTDQTPAVLTGKCTIQAFPMGGDVATQLTTDGSFPITGKPVWTGGVTPTSRGGESKRGSK